MGIDSACTLRQAARDTASSRQRRSKALHCRAVRTAIQIAGVGCQTHHIADLSLAVVEADMWQSRASFAKRRR